MAINSLVYRFPCLEKVKRVLISNSKDYVCMCPSASGFVVVNVIKADCELFHFGYKDKLYAVCLCLLRMFFDSF